MKDSWNHFILGKWVECKRANAKGAYIPNKDKEKEKTIEQEGADTNDCSEKEIDTVNNDKQIQYQRNTIPFTSNPNPMDNYNEVYHCTDKQQSLKIQYQMAYYSFKFTRDNGEKIIDYNNKW